MNTEKKAQFLGPLESSRVLDVSESLHLCFKNLDGPGDGARGPVRFYESVGQLRPAADSSVCNGSQRTQFT